MLLQRRILFVTNKSAEVMQKMRHARHPVYKLLVLTLLTVASMGFDTLDGCNQCHKTAPLPDKHFPLQDVSWKLCGSCHGRDSAATEQNVLLPKMHARHVTELGLECGTCHSFKNEQDETAARASLGVIVENIAYD